MDLDDEFGDLYTDVLAPSSITAATASSFPSSSAKVDPLSTSPDVDFENDEDILCGATDSNLPSVSQTLVPEPTSDSILDQEPAPEHCSIKKDINWDDGDQIFNREESRVHKAYGVAENEAPRTLEPPENGSVGDGNGDREDEARGLEENAEEENAEEEKEVGVFVSEAIPGISSGSFIRFPGVENGLMKNSGRGCDSGDNWEESDSDDDLQIVLNDNVDPLVVGVHMGLNVERNEVRSDDEDEDLVIVADGDPVGEEHEWGKESAQPGVDGERKETGDAAKASGRVMAGLPGIGYNSHGFTHYSSLTYLRPGAAALPGGAVNSAGGAPGQVRPLVTMGPIAGRGRGDWIVPLGKGFQPGIGLPLWGNNTAMRGLGNRSEFTLPPHKTAFDIDIATFEEKLWRHPGVDTSDFFNFGLDEDKWKDYCKQLEQLRLEATMQSKIRVYESGRSEQDYDPDLPPELVAAAGHHDTSVENPHLARTDIGQPDLMRHGRGVPRIWPPIPMGRAIQVEGGYGERLPSMDTRPPRFRDSDSIIEIALQGSIDDDSMTSNGALEGPENVNERDDVREGGHMVEEDDKQGVAEYFERFPPPSNGRMQEMVGRRAPFLCPSPGNNVHEGDGILPFPSDTVLQYHPSSKNKATYPGGLLGTPHGGRWSQGVACDRYPQMGCETVNDAIPNASAQENGCDGHQNEILGDGLEEKQTSEASFPLADEVEKEHIIEQKNDFHNDNVLADIEVEGEETVSDLRIPSETTPDSSLNHSAKKQKLSSRIEQQPAIHDLDDNLRTQSENSKAKSGNSWDYQKLREGGEEEVVQDGRSKKIGGERRCREEEEPTSFRRKDDYMRDGKQEVERSRMAAKVRGDLYHAYPHRDWDANSVNHVRVKNEDYERTRERDDSIGARQRREEEPHGRRDKDDGLRRREHIDKAGSKHRSKVHEIDRNEKDWRACHDKGGPRQRERGDLLMGRHDNSEDPHTKRRREEELQRRERIEKEEALCGYRAREDGSRRKREGDDGLELRRREDQARGREKPDDHHSLRHREASWRQREKEDQQRLKPSHEDAQANRDREEGRGPLRGSRGLEEKMRHGSTRAKDDSKGLGLDRVRDHIKDKRRHGEQVKIKGRVEEEPLSEHRGHQYLYARENQYVNEERNPRHERPTVQNESQQMDKERDKESARRSKEYDVVDQNAMPSGRTRKEDYSVFHRNDKVNARGSTEQEKGNAFAKENCDFRDHGHSKSTSSAAASKKTHHHSQPQTIGQRHSSKKHVDDVPSEDDQQQSSRRGRSKSEHWTSQKERDISSNAQSSSKASKESERNNGCRAYLAIELKESGKKGDLQILDADENAKDDDLVHVSDTQLADSDRKEEDHHLDTVAKLKKRSERFKFPIPTEEVTANKKVESEAIADAEVKHERPTRKRRWVSN